MQPILAQQIQIQDDHQLKHSCTINTNTRWPPVQTIITQQIQIQGDYQRSIFGSLREPVTNCTPLPKK